MTRHVGTSSWGSLKQPINISDREVGARMTSNPLSSVEVMLYYYNCAPGQYKFRYDVTDSQWIARESIISNVTLTYKPDTNIYSLDVGDAQLLNDYVSKRPL